LAEKQFLNYSAVLLGRETVFELFRSSPWQRNSFWIIPQFSLAEKWVLNYSAVLLGREIGFELFRSSPWQRNRFWIIPQFSLAEKQVLNYSAVLLGRETVFELFRSSPWQRNSFWIISQLSFNGDRSYCQPTVFGRGDPPVCRLFDHPGRNAAWKEMFIPSKAQGCQPAKQKAKADAIPAETQVS
jgi:hypothetical protein